MKPNQNTARREPKVLPPSLEISIVVNGEPFTDSRAQRLAADRWFYTQAVLAFRDGASWLGRLLGPVRFA